MPFFGEKLILVQRESYRQKLECCCLIVVAFSLSLSNLSSPLPCALSLLSVSLAVSLALSLYIYISIYLSFSLSLSISPSRSSCSSSSYFFVLLLLLPSSFSLLPSSFFLLLPPSSSFFFLLLPSSSFFFSRSWSLVSLSLSLYLSLIWSLSLLPQGAKTTPPHFGRPSQWGPWHRTQQSCAWSVSGFQLPQTGCECRRDLPEAKVALATFLHVYTLQSAAAGGSWKECLADDAQVPSFIPSASPDLPAPRKGPALLELLWILGRQVCKDGIFKRWAIQWQDSRESSENQKSKMWES